MPSNLVLAIVSMVISILFVALLWTFVKIIKAISGERNRKERMQQLNFENENTQDNILEVIESIVKKTVYKKRTPSKQVVEEVQNNLELIGWDKHFSAEQFLVLRVFSEMSGAILAVPLFFVSPVFSVVVLILGFFMRMWYLGEISNQKEILLHDFVDMIRIVQSYLAVGRTLDRAFEETLPTLTGPWFSIIEDFLMTSRLYGTKEALEKMGRKADIPKIQEFIAALQMSYEYGNDLTSVFDSQAENMEQIYEELATKEMTKVELQLSMVTVISLIIVMCSFGPATYYYVTSVGFF